MSSVVDDLIPCMDEILGVRDDIGAIKHHVYILTRTWDGSEIGDGNYTDTIVQILPTPYLVDYSHSLRLRTGGKIKEGDIIVKHISKESYPSELLVDCSVTDKITEKFYYIDEQFYNVIGVVEGYVYWNVQIRKTSKTRANI